MDIEQYIVFITVTLIIFMSPGPVILVAINNGITYGAKRSVLAILGNVLAMQILICLSVLGIGSILMASTTAFNILKIIGAIYLVYLGVVTWSAKNYFNTFNDADDKEYKNKYFLFKRSFYTTLSNPKALIYVTALLPQFIDTNKEIWLQFLILALTIAIMQFSAIAFYAILASKIRNWITKASNYKIFFRFSGATLVILGIALLFTDK